MPKVVLDRAPRTALKLCGCSDPYQDARYGVGRRVHNMTAQQKKPAERGWRCTKCGKEK